MKKCPSCKYERTTQDDLHFPEYECPSCGVINNKYKARYEFAELEKKRKKERKAKLEKIKKEYFLYPLLAIAIFLSTENITYFSITAAAIFLYGIPTESLNVLNKQSIKQTAINAGIFIVTILLLTILWI